jgi:hypothetical protein
LPLHDLGYRNWQGRLTPLTTRWWVIAETGIRLASRINWLRRLLLLAWLPAIYMGVLFFAFEQSETQPGWRAGAVQTIASAVHLPPEQAIRFATADINEVRHQVWAHLLMVFFRQPQGFALLILVGMVAPPLIANDIRTRAFLLYFSRPVSRGQYILGKSAVVLAYGAMITLTPALGLYAIAVLFSPDLNVIWQTWDLPLRAVAATLVLMVPTTLLALAFSSLAKESRYAGFAWFAAWGLGWAAYAVLNAYIMTNSAGKPPETLPDFRLLSLYHVLGSVQAWVFGTGTTLSDVAAPALVLLAISAVSLVIVFRRVSSPMRV